MYSTTKKEKLFDVFFSGFKEVKPSESLYIDDRRHILKKAGEYGLELLLMERDKKYLESEFEVVNNMNDILEVL